MSGGGGTQAPPATPGGGFTLTEMLVVVLITALLALLILPSYGDRVLHTRRALARLELREVLARQEGYYMERGRYATTLADLGLPGDPYALDGEGARTDAQDPGRAYRVELSAGDGGFLLHARPQGRQRDDPCGALRLSWTGATAAGAADCW